MQRARSGKIETRSVLWTLLGFFNCCIIGFLGLTRPLHAESDSYRNRVTAPRVISSITMPLTKELHFTGTALYDNALYGVFGYGSLEYAFTKSTGFHSGLILFREPVGDVVLARFGPTMRYEHQALRINGRLLLESHFTTRPQHVATYMRVRPKLHATLHIFPDSEYKPGIFGSFETVFATHYKKAVERLDYAGGISFKPTKRIAMTLSYYRWHWTVPKKKDSQGLRITMHYVIPYSEGGKETETLWEMPSSVEMGGEE